MAVLVEDFKSGFLSASIVNSDTSLSSSEFANLQAVSSPDTMKIVLDPQGVAGDPEIVTITAHTAAATTITVTRGLGARSHASGTRWVHAVTASDFQRMGFEGNLELADANLESDSPTLTLTDTDTNLTDGELAGAIEFYTSDLDSPGVGAYIHADGDGTVGGMQFHFGTGTGGAAADRMTIDSLGNVTITGGLTVQGAGGYDMQVFTSSGSFTKATYPWARNIRVRVVGGGGGSGAAVATSASQISVGGAGAAGGYAESVVAVSALAASETVTVGTGGAAGTSGGNGGDGTASSFGTHAAANGGTGGFFGGAQGAPGRSGNGGTGGSATAGDLQIKGGDGERLVVASTSRVETTVGGASSLSNIRGRRASTTTQGGTAGNEYGGGANGPANAASQSASDGSAGADGIVIVEIFG